MGKQLKKIFFVAASSGVSEAEPKFLAASKKIRLILCLLVNAGYDVVLINTAPDMGVRQSAKFDKIAISENASISRLTVPSYKQRKFGRLRNIFDALTMLRLVVEEFGRPDLVWCYNGYSFEMRFAVKAKRAYGCPVLLEFEDWHFARSGIGNPKAVLDWFFWRKATPHIDYCYAVNPRLQRLMEQHGVESGLMPGAISDHIARLRQWSPPTNGQAIKVGYFGGLSTEKGGSLLLEMINSAVSEKLSIHFVVTGGGELAAEFKDLSNKAPSHLSYHGIVDEKTLCGLIGDVHFLLNPHQENSGVFPFKVLEGIASGRPVISGPLNIEGTNLQWLMDGVTAIELSAPKWLSCIQEAGHKSQNTEAKRISVRKKAMDLYSVKGLATMISKRIGLLTAKV